MWIAPLWKSTRRKSIHEGQPPGSLISQGSRVHRISHVAGLFSSSLVLGKALFFLAWFLGKPVICSSHLPDLYCWVHRDFTEFLFAKSQATVVYACIRPCAPSAMPPATLRPSKHTGKLPSGRSGFQNRLIVSCSRHLAKYKTRLRPSAPEQTMAQTPREPASHLVPASRAVYTGLGWGGWGWTTGESGGSGVDPNSNNNKYYYYYFIVITSPECEALGGWPPACLPSGPVADPQCRGAEDQGPCGHQEVPPRLDGG
ncbi:uncharacterized protein LOC119864294 [Canis lupus familiaris]|uniref:uncharacterized protein LOC119864294 n=1 Tax=Canis lupus familiaris TaxID=9615 RepID=UPI0018F5511B|nr:uncharacterized protein LOC119864294 [Canis lupus familiaris]XP_038310353.1 uncharacterized protein LOC119864294 [Canis lupus familiaris]XP_038420393.1 uncharacterized protein LOC119864294 [Canis lupus familiaris]